MNPTENQLVRVELMKTDDSGEQQKVQASGRANEQFGDKHLVMRIQAHGFSSHPPKGSQGILLAIGGNPDQAMILDMEHKDHRPKNLGEGDSRMYDSHGNYLHMKDGEAVMHINGDMTMEVTGDLTIKVSGTLIVDCSDINLGGTGGKPVAVQGTGTSDGATLTSNFASTVKAV